MALHLVLLPTILAFALTRNEQCVPSPTTTTTTTTPPTTLPTSTNSTTTPKACPNSDTSMPGAIERSANRPTFPTTTATPPATTTNTSITTPKSCPPGYQLHPEFNCYKAFREWRTWSEARDQCVRDGGDLMVMETERERQDVYIPLSDSESWIYLPWVGVYKPEGEDGWMTVNGEPVPSTWWKPGEPDNYPPRKCARAAPTGLLLNWACDYNGPFICEISFI